MPKKMYNITKIVAISLIGSIGVIGLTSCSVDKRTAESQQAEQLPSETFNPELVIEEPEKPSKSLTIEELKSSSTVDLDYQTNITLDVPKDDYKLWIGKSSEPVIANFVSSDGMKAPYIEGLMSGVAEIVIINSDTKEEFTVTVNVVNKG